MVTSGSLARGLAMLERLAGEADGMPLSQLANDLGLAKSAAHRVLAALVDEGFVHQVERSGNYALTLRLASLGLRHLADATISELATPLLARLAGQSGQLVRLALVDGDQLLWVAKVQGARTGLRYEPDHWLEVPLALSASGHAWLSRLPEERAMRLAATQLTDARHPIGHNAPRYLFEVMAHVRAARERGWAFVRDSAEEGISAMAAPVVSPPPQHASGVVSIAGPTLQLDEKLMHELVPSLHALAAELCELAASSRGGGTIRAPGVALARPG